MSNRTISFLFCILFLIKLLAIYFTNFNLFGDEAQYWLWSKDVDVGYFSKPPFLSWFISVYTYVFGDSFFSLKILPSFIYLLIAVAIYDLSRNVDLDRAAALSCVLIFLFIPAVSFSSFILSTDLFLLFFWTLSLNMLVRIKKSPNKTNFILLGIFIGLAFLSKYAAIYFVLCFLIYALLDKKFQKLLLSNLEGVVLCILCAIIVFSPNIIWNLKNGWVTLQHTSDNANFNNIKINPLRGFEFLFFQILMVGPILFLTNILNYNNIKINPNTKLLLIFSLPIFLIVFIEAIVVRANANWAAPALISFFLFLYLNVHKLKSFFFKLNVFFNFIFCVIFFVLIGVSYPSPVFDRINGLNYYANELLKVGKSNKINDYVISDRLLFASLSYELRNHNLNFYMPHKEGDKITNHFKITSPLRKEMNRNFVLVGEKNDIYYLDSDFECAQKYINNPNELFENLFPPFKTCSN